VFQIIQSNYPHFVVGQLAQFYVGVSPSESEEYHRNYMIAGRNCPIHLAKYPIHHRQTILWQFPATDGGLIED